MGQQTSKEELLYQQVSYGNVEGIRRLCEDGASLEWVDREGKTPLVVACMNPDLFDVAKALIELGANVNANNRRFHAGTPLHCAAKRGLDQTVKLLLSHGANALVMNLEFQSPLDVARAKGHLNIVRIIESHICFFSGWMRQLHGPGFLEALVPQWVTSKVWAVVIPRNSRDPNKPLKLELSVYPAAQDQKEEEMTREHEVGCRRRRRRRRRRRTRREKQAAQPCVIIQLWKASIEEPNFNEPDPSLVINEKATRKRFKFLAANEGDKQQLEWFYNACRGMQQRSIPSSSIPATETTSAPAVTQYALRFSDLDSAIKEKPPGFSTGSGPGISDSDGSNNSDDKDDLGDTEPDGQAILKKISAGRLDQPSSSGDNSQETPEVEPGKTAMVYDESELSSSFVTAWIQHNDPSAMQAIECPDDGPILYPTVDTSPIDLSVPTPETGPATSNLKEDGDASACAICLDAPKEGACVPCGHVVGCMPCLNDIKDKGWGCPVCRAEVRQVLKLYTV